VYAVTLDLTEEGRKGPVAHRLVRPGEREGSGTIRLTPAEREALLGGRLMLSVYSAEGVASAPVRMRGT
jgi:hypothetical protein